MKRKTIKRILAGAGSVFLLLAAVLCAHIYIATRPRPAGPNSLVMARIDLGQPITQDDAEKISGWLYLQKGIDHVLCNAKTDKVVFTYHPSVTNGNDIANAFRVATGYKNAVRYLPTQKEMQSSCPVAATSMTYKLYSFFRTHF